MPVPNDVAGQMYTWLVNETAKHLAPGAVARQVGLSLPGEPGSQGDIPSPMGTPGTPDPGIPGTAGPPSPMGGGDASYGAWNPNWDKYGTPASNAAGFGPWGGPGADGPPAWLAQEALKAYKAGDQARMKHLLDSATGPDGPKGTLGHHIVNFLTELFAGNANREAEAVYYSTNPSSAGIPDFGGTKGDLK